MEDRALYRSVIDDLVRACREGQGQVGPDRVRRGAWEGADELLAELDVGQRETLAGMLEHAFISGVHQTLVTLHEAAVAPFDDGYEGTPFHDFIGRLDGWEWPAC